MERIPLDKVLVELEATEDGRQKVKLSENGEHPYDALGKILEEVDSDYRAKFKDDLFKFGSYWEQGEKGERPHEILVLYSYETGEKVPIRRFVAWDKKTNRPVQKPSKVMGKPGMRTMDRKDTLEHVANYVDWSQIHAKAEARKLHIQTANSWDILEKAKQNLEG